MRSLPEEPSSSLYALAADILEKPAYWPQAHPEFQPDGDQIEQLNHDLDRLLAGEPLPYILGRQAFFGLDFFVNPDVLIPRPETEILVNNALEWLQDKSGSILAADVGTGSACIAVSIAMSHSNIHFIASDISSKSLLVAKRNIEKHERKQQIDLVQTDLLRGLYGQFNMICANLPYIPTRKLENLSVAEHEPRIALDGGEDGLDQIDKLLEQSHDLIKSPGLILLEMEYSQAKAIRELIQTHFSAAGVTIIHDLNDLPRLAKIEL